MSLQGRKTRSRAAASGHRSFNVRYPAMNPVGRPSQAGTHSGSSRLGVIGPLGSVRSRSLPTDLLAVSAIKLTFSRAAGAAMSVSNAWDRRHRRRYCVVSPIEQPLPRGATGSSRPIGVVRRFLPERLVYFGTRPSPTPPRESGTATAVFRGRQSLTCKRCQPNDCVRRPRSDA